MVNNRRGRPPGGSDARERLLAVMSERIRAGDAARWSTRRLAESAGVSHSLVNYHFGGRQGLMMAAYALSVAPHQVIEASRIGGTLDPALLIRGLVAVWEHPGHGTALAELARSATSESAGADLVDYLQTAVLGTLIDALGIDRGRRLALTIVGTIMTRYVLRLPSMTTLSTAELIRLMRVTAGC